MTKRKRKKYKKRKNYNQENLEVSKENLAVNQEQLKLSKKSITINKWNLAIGAILIILTSVSIGYLAGIKFDINNLFQNEGLTKEYEVNITVSPNEVIMNQDDIASFEFKVENIGLKKIDKFKINRIILYRPVDKITRQIGTEKDYSNNLASLVDGLNVGELYRFEVEARQCCEKFFDDKDKTVQIIVYIESLPPTEFKVIDLKII